MAGYEEVLALIKSRRCIRKYADRPVTDEQVNRILEAMRWAPSGGNLQPWAFYVVRSSQVKNRLVAAALGQTFLAEAPVVIGVAAVPGRSGERYKARGESLYCLQDTAAAVQNALLMAKAMGLGTCWVGAFQDDEVAKALSLPPEQRPVALIPVGYPEQDPQPRPRRELVEVVTIID